MANAPERAAPGSRPVLLVVDDAPASLALLCDTLEAAGYTVLVAPDGEAALQRLALVVPDAILLDAVMPGLTGFETCRRIKAEPAWAHVPVLFMTGLSDTEHVLEGFASGGVDYVTKPVRPPEVLARLATHTRNARLARLAREAADVAGLGVVLADGQGRIAWLSPRAACWLRQAGGAGPPADGRLPPELDAVRRGELPQHVLARPEAEGAPVLVRRMGAAGPGETMLLLEERRGSSSRLAQAALTPREAEVLSWLAKGKTNRDIGDILGLSPRTVNKHLEHIYEKLGVETRAAAAALASAEGAGVPVGSAGLPG